MKSYRPWVWMASQRAFPARKHLALRPISHGLMEALFGVGHVSCVHLETLWPEAPHSRSR